MPIITAATTAVTAAERRTTRPYAAIIFRLLRDQWHRCSGGIVPAELPRTWQSRASYHVADPVDRVGPRKVSRDSHSSSGRVLVKRITNFLTVSLPRGDFT